MADKMYECTNEDCVLGGIGQSGYFTEGMTPAQKNLKTGMPTEQMEEGKDYGENICPECGRPAEEVGEFTPLVGDDPHAALHEQVHAEIAPQLDELRQKRIDGEISEEEFATAAVTLSEEAQSKVQEGVDNATNTS